jgi:hypothetical protein
MVRTTTNSHGSGGTNNNAAGAAGAIAAVRSRRPAADAAMMTMIRRGRFCWWRSAWVAVVAALSSTTAAAAVSNGLVQQQPCLSPSRVFHVRVDLFSSAYVVVVVVSTCGCFFDIPPSPRSHAVSLARSFVPWLSLVVVVAAFVLRRIDDCGGCR